MTEHIVDWTPQPEDWGTLAGLDGVPIRFPRTLGRVDGVVRYTIGELTTRIEGEEKGRTTYHLAWYPRGRNGRSVEISNHPGLPKIESPEHRIEIANKHTLYHRNMLENIDRRPEYISPKDWDIDHAVENMRSIEMLILDIERKKRRLWDYEKKEYPERHLPTVRADQHIACMNMAYGVEIALKSLCALAHPNDPKAYWGHRLSRLTEKAGEDEDIQQALEDFGWHICLDEIVKIGFNDLYVQSRYSPETPLNERKTLTINPQYPSVCKGIVYTDTIVGQFAALVEELKFLRENRISWAYHSCYSEGCGQWWADT